MIRLKICGVQNAEEVQELVSRKVEFMGFNFVPASRRCITIDLAQQMMKTANKADTVVALFQDAPLVEVLDMLERLEIQYVQLHGSESAEYTQKLISLGYKVIKSVPINEQTTLGEAEKYITAHPANLYLLDRAQQGAGEPVNLDIATQLARKHKLFLAGGLNLVNLKEAINKAEPYGIDIAGGVRDGLELNLDKLDEVIEILRAK